VTGCTFLARLRDSPWRRLAIALVGVPAILIGLLAMHVLTNGGMSGSSSPHTISAHTAVVEIDHSAEAALATAADPSMPLPASDCGGMCGPSHDVLGMICVLALLATVVLLALHLVLIRWEELRRVVATLLAKASAMAPLEPPSLHVLSISRT